MVSKNERMRNGASAQHPGLDEFFELELLRLKVWLSEKQPTAATGRFALFALEAVTLGSQAAFW